MSNKSHSEREKDKPWQERSCMKDIPIHRFPRKPSHACYVKDAAGKLRRVVKEK
jgi:hypothetical protein